MEARRFDALIRGFSATRSRRQTVGALLAGAAALTGLKEQATAGPGCKDVGQRCKEARDCCSGRCRRGKTGGPKRCKPHDVGGCKAGQDACAGVSVPCTSNTGFAGTCFRTTGNAGYCVVNVGNCLDKCARDADCEKAFGKRAACIACDLCPTGTVCAGPNGEG
jgi:hypothetical protein